MLEKFFYIIGIIAVVLLIPYIIVLILWFKKVYIEKIKLFYVKCWLNKNNEEPLLDKNDIYNNPKKIDYYLEYQKIESEIIWKISSFISIFIAFLAFIFNYFYKIIDTEKHTSYLDDFNNHIFISSLIIFIIFIIWGFRYWFYEEKRLKTLKELINKKEEK